MFGKLFKNIGFSWFIEIVMWIAIVLVSLFISEYVGVKIGITDEFIQILLSAVIVSIFAQMVLSHIRGDGLNLRWFIFYFLVYTIIIWIMKDFVLIKFDIQTDFVAFLLTGLAVSLIILAIDKIGLRSHTVPWVSTIILLVLAVSYYSHFTGGIDLSQKSAISENGLACPSLVGDFSQTEPNIDSVTINSGINSLLDTSVWRIENNFRNCYKGKYQGQRPDWFYCDDLIVSRYELSTEGTINYRWYTAVSAVFKPVNTASVNPFYNLEQFSCENGQRVTIKKGTTQYYVYDSRDGTPIKIKY